MAQHNLDTNFPRPTDDDARAARQRVTVTTLCWGDPDDIDALEPPFDLLLGSDLIYHRGHHEKLAATLDKLSKEGSVALFASPDGGPDASSRPEADGRSGLAFSFYSAMKARGWECVDITDSSVVARLIDDVLTEDEFGNRGRAETYWGRGPIRVAQMTKKSGGGVRTVVRPGSYSCSGAATGMTGSGRFKL
jgi:hypothetical protein